MAKSCGRWECHDPPPQPFYSADHTLDHIKPDPDPCPRQSWRCGLGNGWIFVSSQVCGINIIVYLHPSPFRSEPPRSWVENIKRVFAHQCNSADDVDHPPDLFWPKSRPITRESVRSRAAGVRSRVLGKAFWGFYFLYKKNVPQVCSLTNF